MNKGLWISRKNYLFTLIKKASDALGGDNKKFLQEHCIAVIEANPEEKIEDAIKCYEDIINILELYPEWSKHGKDDG